MSNVLALFTCFNRKACSVKCVETLTKGNPNINFRFIVADDNSKDGTEEALLAMDQDIIVKKGNGSLFYSGGMRLAIQTALELKDLNKFDYIMLMNDDVVFMDYSIEKIVGESKSKNDAVIIGAMQWDTGILSYGGVKYDKGIHYTTLGPEKSDIACDTFCANCVLIPLSVFKQAGQMDTCYIHSLGDFDYGMKISRMGIKMYTSSFFVGQCNDNSRGGTWMDNSLSLRERIKRKESPKGNPTKQWFHYLKKYFGLHYAVWYSLTPYFRIILKK